jgi:helix-turn-helix resolvase-like protein
MSKRPSPRAGGKPAAKAKKPAAKKPAPRAEPIELPQPKRGRGRPSSYSPEFCERVIEMGEMGKSKAQIARELGVCRQVLYSWVKVHPEFAEAMEESQWRALAWWEDVGQAGLSMGSKFNAALYAFHMKNRFRGEYGDKTEVEHSGRVEADPEGRQLTDLDLARRVAFVLNEGMEAARRQEQQQEQRHARSRPLT